MSDGATEKLFIEDSYRREDSATVTGLSDDGAILLDRTIFYATSGGQPGDTGHLERADGTKIGIEETRYAADRAMIEHRPKDGSGQIDIGEKVGIVLDWPRRHALMRMHSACHLLSVICPFPITSANVGETESRVDFDIPDPKYDKAYVSERLMELVNGNHPIFTRWIEEAELDANPDLVRSKNVRPPRGTGRVRLVCIGEDSSIDSQPCGGTHVEATAEIGAIHIGKIEKKGRENRRFRIRFGEAPAP